MYDEETATKQNDEFEALKAIFCNTEIKDLRKRVWNQWKPLHFILPLTPQQGSSGVQDGHCQIDLNVKCCHNYPNRPPILKIQNARGISEEKIKQLEVDLQSKAKEYLGEVMIYELAAYAQEFLYKFSKPASKSFYEEMQLRQQKEKAAKELELDKQRQELQNDIMQRQEILKQESKKWKDERRNSENSSFSDPIGTGSFAESNNEVFCAHKKKTIVFSSNNKIEVIRGQCLKHLEKNCILFSAVEIENGALYFLYKWIFDDYSDSNQAEKQTNSIEQELRSLLKLQHKNLVSFINCSHFVDTDEQKIVINVLTEFILGSSCYTVYLKEGIQVERDMLRKIAESVTNALDFLHRNNVVHKNLSVHCVFICSNGMIKVSNYSIMQRINDMVSHCQVRNYNKKTDVYKFGILLLSLLMGTTIEEDQYVEIPLHISYDLKDFIDKCLAIDEHRSSVHQLAKHIFLQAPASKMSPAKRPKRISENQQRNYSPDENVDDIKVLAQNNLNGKSRFDCEFELLENIGKGAYGRVYKVRNILDQGYYAIKHIELNPRNKLINRKIIREVKLLSKLNHENVVRYYNSWIETAVVDYSILGDAESSSKESVKNSPERAKRKEVLFKTDDSLIEKLAPASKDVEWSISYGNKSKLSVTEAISEEEPDSSNDEFENDWRLGDDSDSIEFRDEESVQEAERSSPLCNSRKLPEGEPEEIEGAEMRNSSMKEIQFMYIQMEFCEKSTLRTAIDNNLYVDNDRLWRLFREIVEGLAHIHQQGMIHRDLKPANIFLDLNDHVKIGDFGLATSNYLLVKPNDVLLGNRSDYDDGSQAAGGDPSMTGHIGTALYVAPELMSTGKASYNQKVDIYSLGIIFFEMCNRPFPTGSERISVLSKVRSPDIVFDEDFEKSATDNQKHIIRWLLDHNVSNRPTSQELLQSDYIPPPVWEERELQERVRHILSNPQLKAYKHLIQSCFKQPLTPAQDISYDKDIAPTHSVSRGHQLQVFNHLKTSFANIFELHGALNIATPLLMPISKYYEGNETCVRLMTHSGSIVSIPHDLRVPFARFVAWNGITSLRRYSIERVFREKKAFGFAPRELYECAFDIVSPTAGNLMADAEVLHILNKIVNEVEGLRNKNILIRLNHTLLLKAVLLHCGLKDKYNELYGILAEAREGKVNKNQLRTHLVNRGLSNNAIITLFRFLESDSPIEKIANCLQSILKKKNSEPSLLAKEALNDLKKIVENAIKLNVTINIVISIGLVYNAAHYSGMMCQLVCDVKRKHKQVMEILAAGGRYDTMIASYRMMVAQANLGNNDCKQSAVGVSISLDKFVQAEQQRERELMEESASSATSQTTTTRTHLDLVVCSLAASSNFLDGSHEEKKYKVLCDLWALGIKAVPLEATTLEEIKEQCNELNVPHVVFLKDDRAKFYSRADASERFHEFSLAELADNVQRIVKSSADANNYWTEIVNRGGEFSKGGNATGDGTTTGEANVTIVFVQGGDDKFTFQMKKRLENQIKSQMSSIFKKLMGNVTLLALNIEGALLKTMASYLDFESSESFNKSVDSVKDRHQKYKKYVDHICDEIYDHKSKSNNHSIILFSIPDGVYKVLL